MSLLPEHVTLKIIDGRIPDHGLVPRLIREVRDRAPRRARAPLARAARADRAVLDGARGGGAVALRGLRLPGERGDVVRHSGRRERRRGAARSGRHRRPRGTPLCVARFAGARPACSTSCSPTPRAARRWVATRGRACSACSAGRTPPRSSRTSSRKRDVLLTVDLDQLGVSAGDRLLDVGCGEGRHCFGALERGARVVGLDLDLPSLRKGHGPAARARDGTRPLGRDAARRRLPPAVPRRQLRPRDLLGGDGARARLPRRRARTRARGATGRHGGRHGADRHQRTSLPAARRRLLRVARRPHPDLRQERARRRAARRGPRADRHRFRARLPHAVLGAALDRRVCRARTTSRLVQPIASS